MTRLRRFVLLSALVLTGTPLAAVTAYPYGSLPTGAADADLTTVYNLWKTRRLVTASCGSRVDNGGGGTYSEGMGYGMLMAAYLESNDTLLAQLYQFYSANFDSRGLMNWSVASTSCSNNSANAATDGDLDAALALVRAAKRWPASSNNWSAKATTLLNNIYTYMVDGCKGLKNGDTWGGCGDTGNKAYNPSYFRTGYLKSFDCFEGGTRWAAVRTQSYSVLAKTISSYKLPPDWTYNNGNYGTATNSGGYGYDSCRTPFSVGMDYLWWGNTTAQTLDNQITTSMAAQGAASTIGDDYNYSTGAKVSNNHEPEFIGGIGVASMCGTNSTYRDAVYTELKNTDKNSYFSDSLRVIYMMVMTGNFPEPCTGGGPAGSPTASPTRTPTFTASPTPTPAFSLVKSAAAASVALGATVTYYLDYSNLSTGPDTTGVTSGVALEFHNSSTGSSATRSGTNFQIDNNSGGAINLSNYRIRYFLYDASKVATTDYAIYTYSDATGVGAGSMVSYPSYTGGPRNANMEFRLGFGSYSLASGSTVQWQGAVGSNSDSWNMTMTDDWSYPGAVGSFSTANAANIVLEQNVGGIWKPVTGAYPGGAASIANVSISDVLDSRLTYVASQPAGTWTSGTSTFSYTIASLAPGATGRITLTAQVNGTAVVGNVIPNSGSIGASGYPSASSNIYNVTVSGSASPTPTRTGTRTSTPSATPSNSPSRTATPTASPSVSSSPTPSASPSRSPTATASPTSVIASATPTPTATPSRTVSATPSATASASPTQSPSATATVSASATPTATRSATPSGTPTATTSRTASPSGTPSATRSATASATASVSPSATRSATPSATASASPSQTRSATATATASASPTATPTRTSTASISPTFTDVPPGSTETATPTISPTDSPTPSRTATASATPTATASATLTASSSATPSASPSETASATGSPTASQTESATPTASPSGSATASVTPSASPTDTFTASPSVSPSPTASPSFTDGPSPTPTASPTATPSQTPSATPSASPSRTPSPSATATSTGSGTASPTHSPTATVTVSATGSLTLSPSPTLSQTQGAGPSATPTATGSVAAEGPLEIVEHHVWPMPLRPGGPAYLSFKLSGSADGVSLKIYSRAWVCVVKLEDGPHPVQWSRLALPRSFVDDGAAGAYYYVLSAKRDGATVIHPAKGTLLLLR